MNPAYALLHLGSLATLLSLLSISLRSITYRSTEIEREVGQLKSEIKNLLLRMDLELDILDGDVKYISPLFNSLHVQFLLYVAGLPTKRSPFYVLPFFLYRAVQAPLLGYFRQGSDQSVSIFLFGASSLAFLGIVAVILYGPAFFGTNLETFMYVAFLIFSITIVVIFIHVLALARLRNLQKTVNRIAHELEFYLRESIEREMDLARENVSAALSKIADSEAYRDR